jgi:quercetin 2,3-dioxygenase
MVQQFRAVQRVMARPRQHWVGNGFHVYPVFADLAFTEELSPLLMFDYAAPKEFKARMESSSSPLGVGMHPHRGFETVTVAFGGEVEHHDNKGGTGIIGTGDVQWMTAGRGIVHQEYHSKEFTRQGGMFEMCQLWVNLPRKDKMTKPGYQAIKAGKIPIVSLPLNTEKEEEQLGTARIIAGELGPTKGAAKTHSPVQLWDVTLPTKGTIVDLPFPADQTCIIFVRKGSVNVLSGGEEEGASSTTTSTSTTTTTLGPQDVALMRKDGSHTLRLRVNQADSSVLIMGGESLNEPIAAQGPFVMNTPEEISKAMTDYRMGKF